MPGADTGNYYGCDAGYRIHIQTTVYGGDGLLMIPCVLPSAPIMVLSFVIVWAKHYISCEAIGPVLFDQFYPKVIEDELQ